MGLKRAATVTFHTLAATGAGTVNGTSFAVDNFNSGIILVYISAIGGSPTMEAIIQASLDNANWHFYGTVIDEITVDNLTEPTPNPDKGKIKTANTFEFFLPYVLANYMRVQLVIAGTGTPTFTGTVKGVFKG